MLKTEVEVKERLEESIGKLEEWEEEKKNNDRILMMAFHSKLRNMEESFSEKMRHSSFDCCCEIKDVTFYNSKQKENFSSRSYIGKKMDYSSHQFMERERI